MEKIDDKVQTTRVLPSSQVDTTPDEDITKDVLEPPSEPGEIGRFDGWPIRRVLGRGGMALVFQSHDEKLGRDVAIKVMSPQLAENEVSRTRFAREAKLMAKLRSDRIVAVYSVNDDHILPYIVMELVDGGTLRDRLRMNGPMPSKELRQLTLDLCEGLEVAHQQGLLHRDLKPANVGIRSADKRAVVMDFGLARAVCDTAPLTEHGISPGTPAYMSPEQVKGAPLTRQSDLFSLGTLLYVAATGETPFRGEDVTTTCDAVVRGEYHDVGSVRRDLSPEMAAIIRKLMAQQLTDRYASASQIIEELNKSETRSIGWRWPLVAIAAAVLLVGGAMLASGIILQIKRQDGTVEEIPLDGVDKIVIVPKDGEIRVQQLEAETEELDEWRAQPNGREVVINRDATSGAVTISNPREDYDWVMAFATAKLSEKKPRYLHVDVREVGGSDQAGWYLKMAPDGFGGSEIHLASGQNTGRFVIAMPTSVLDSNIDRWVVQVFATGPQHSKVAFRDVRFVDEIPDGVEEVLSVP